MPRQMTMLSLQPEDLTRLDKLAQAAGLNRSAYIRLLLKVQEAKFEGKEDQLRIMSDRENKESPSGDEEGGQGSEARFLTKKIPNCHWYINVKIKNKCYWMVQGKEETFQDQKAMEEAEARGFEWHGVHNYMSTEDLLKDIEKEKQIVPYDFSEVRIRTI